MASRVFYISCDGRSAGVLAHPPEPPGHVGARLGLEAARLHSIEFTVVASHSILDPRVLTLESGVRIAGARSGRERPWGWARRSGAALRLHAQA
jgi:hypothetical protein